MTATATITAPVRLVLERLPNARLAGTGKWSARCPAHDDRVASLSIATGEDGRVLFHCHAGCKHAEICAALGLVVRDLFPPKQNGTNGCRPKLGVIVTTYDYVTTEGELLYQVTRHSPKNFRQRRPDGNGGWIWNLNGVPRTLYRYPEVLDADLDSWLFVVEGEKDVNRLWDVGLVATCNAQGAGKWEDKFGEMLRGRRVAVIPDNDEPGRKHARAVAASCSGKAADVRLVELPGLPDKGDVSDYLDAGGTPKRLLALVEAANPFHDEPSAPSAVDGANTKTAAPEAAGLLNKYDPLPTARKFLADHYRHRDGQTLRLSDDVFYAWNGTAYAEVKPSRLRAELYPWLERHKRIITVGAGEMIVPFQPTKADVDKAVDALKALTYTDSSPPAWLVDPRGLPDPARLLVARNGIFDLMDESGQPFRRPTPQLFTVNALDYDYDADAPEPAAWLGFLDALWPNDPESVALLRQWFGYCLTADTRHQKMLLLVGPKRSGKGTIGRVLAHMIGLANICGPTLAGLSIPFGLWGLIGKRLALISDARLSGRTDQAVVTERLLTISGEDAVEVHRKNLPSVTLKLPTRIMLLTNELPRLQDSSGALASRFLVLILKRSFYGQEDTALTDRLLGELPGILKWAIGGWRDLQKQGRFAQPVVGQEVIDELDNLASPAGAFVRDWCQVKPGLLVAVPDLYDAWCFWCEEQGIKRPGDSASFGRDLRAVVPALTTRQRRDEGERVRKYIGIDLTSEAAAIVGQKKAARQGVAFGGAE
jgi:putative DNA primase/helicase